MKRKPYSPQKPCSKKGCKELVSGKERFCELHQQKFNKDRWTQGDLNRESSYKRGYDDRWRKFRKHFIGMMIDMGNYVCNDCNNTFIDTADIQVDHIKPLCDHPELKYDMRNLQMLCRQCHTKKTINDNKGL